MARTESEYVIASMGLPPDSAIVVQVVCRAVGQRRKLLLLGVLSVGALSDGLRFGACRQMSILDAD
jgi:hypothetical protein